MREIFIPNTDGVLPTTVFPLCNNNQRGAILASMPRCDAQGIVGVEEEAVPAPERTSAPRKRLETVAQRDARRRGGSSRGSGSPRESRSSRGSGDVDGDDDEALPDNIQGAIRGPGRVRGWGTGTAPPRDSGVLGPASPGVPRPGPCFEEEGFGQHVRR